MSAIAGVVRLDGMPDVRGYAQYAMARMAHRVPDGVAFFNDEGFALAYGALHTTPESLFECQPLRVGERWVLAVDGRIDNRNTLLAAFGIDAHEAVRTADVDLFAHAWQRWGAEFWRHVVGDFAIAVWDRHQHRLQLFRDRVGQRPLYYARTLHLLAFATEPEALLGLPGVSRTCHADGLAYLLCPTFRPEDLGVTLYRDVRRVLPGEYLIASAPTDVRVSRYWTMQPGKPLSLGNPREYIDAFSELFGEAVRCRLRTLHRPALMLSGGIDSAGVFAAAGGLALPEGLHRLLPVSVTSDVGKSCDETTNILRMHEHSKGICLPVERLPGSALFDQLRAAVWNLAHPIDNSIFLARLVYLAARNAGSNVVLDGADGDVLMRVNHRHAAEHVLAGNPLQGLREARLASRVNTYLRGVSPTRILARGMAAKLEPNWLAQWRCRIIERQRGDELLGPWIDRDFAARHHLRERRLATTLSSRRAARGLTHSEDLIRSWWNPGFTRTMEGMDRTAACFGVEARHPWCDQRVVEFFLNLPQEYTARDGWTKWIVRAAYAERLGESVAWHSGKGHLGSEIAERLVTVDAMRVSRLLAAVGERLSGVVDTVTLQRLQESLLAWPQAEEPPDLYAIGQLASIAAWIERYDLTID